MKPKAVPVTLVAIAKLLDKKLGLRFAQNNKAIFSRFDSLEGKTLGIYGELDGIKQQIEAHRHETKEGFDTVFDGLESLGRVIDKDHEPRIKRLETKVFA